MDDNERPPEAVAKAKADADVFLDISRALRPLAPEQRRRIVRACIALYEIDMSQETGR